MWMLNLAFLLMFLTACSGGNDSPSTQTTPTEESQTPNTSQKDAENEEEPFIVEQDKDACLDADSASPVDDEGIPVCGESITISSFHNLHVSRFSKCVFDQADPNTTTNSIKGIFCSQDTSLKSVQDLHYFSALENLVVTGTGLTTIDLSKNPKLKRLELQDNDLQQIDLSKNIALEYLDLRKNTALDSIDLTQLTKLKHIDLPDHLAGSGDNIIRLRGEVKGITADDAQVKVDFSGDIWTLKNQATFDVRLSTYALQTIRFINQPDGFTCQFEAAFSTEKTSEEITNNIFCAQ